MTIRVATRLLPLRYEKHRYNSWDFSGRSFDLLRVSCWCMEILAKIYNRADLTRINIPIAGQSFNW